MLQAGVRLEEAKVLPESVLLRDTWGEIWRASHDTRGPVFLVCYNGPRGAAVLAEARPTLERWQQLAESGQFPHLLEIHEWVQIGGATALIVRNPGGRTFREAFSQRDEKALKSRAGALANIAKGLVIAKHYGLHFAGITPDTVVEAQPNSDAPWRLIPVAPGARTNADVLSGGRYLAPELATSDKIDDLNADVYGLSWLAIEAFAGDFLLERNPARLREYVIFQRLRTLLSNGVTPAKGLYSDPKLFQIGLERWAKNEADDDLREVEEARAAAGRTKSQQWFHTHRRSLVIGLVSAVILLILGLGLALMPRLLTASNTTKTPYGVTNLFFEALVARDTNKARSYTTGEATGQVEALMGAIATMEQQNLASRFAKAVPSVQGAGQSRNVKVDLKGRSGDLFMIAEMTLRQADGGTWAIEKLFFEPTRQGDP